MNWQDLIFAIGSVLFTLALLPAVRAIEKPPRSTCALTAAILWVFVPTYASLDLVFSMWTGSTTAALWTVLFFQKRLLTDPVDEIEDPPYRKPPPKSEDSGRSATPPPDVHILDIP